MEEIVLNGKVYAEKTPPILGNRFVVVLDRGWIYGGDLTEGEGKITLTNVVWPMYWSEIGFDGMLKDPKNPKVKLKKLDHTICVPDGVELFRVPVAHDWGL